MKTSVLTPEQVIRVQNSLKGWAWNTPQQLVHGINVLTAPSSESGEHRNGVIRCVFVTNRTTGLPRKNYILSLRAGWSLAEGQCPQDLLNAVAGTQDHFLAVKNRYQISISFNPDIETQAKLLKQLWPDYETAIPDDEVKGKKVIGALDMRIIGLQFAAGTTSALAQTKKGGFLFNYRDIEFVAASARFEDGHGIERQGMAIDPMAAFAQLGIAQTVGAEPITPSGAPMNNPIEQSRNVLNTQAPAGQPDPAVVDYLKATNDFAKLSEYLNSFKQHS